MNTNLGILCIIELVNMIVNNKTLLMLYEQYYLLYNKGGMLPYISEISFFYMEEAQ